MGRRYDQTQSSNKGIIYIMNNIMNQNLKSIEVENQKDTAGSHNHLRLYSINKTSQILGIRHQLVRKMILDGRLNAIDFDGKFKVPMASIEDFIKNQQFQPEQKKSSRGPVRNIEERIERIIKRHS